ncbi:hypothetical protein H1D32_01260 [Anaerobacillus sp. CMMVII]|uniref:hypothetical protein n=1 Tax=Anaerobacillus sp. CMMVII TaxID=2755588 RepID=UPI0021B752B0|nr:hypothetical protein [Anaerobacillus sp. CMMVII]MCT8136510.1 hypothetical protein [Anaerobacillus sp. CMMVII]
MSYHERNVRAPKYMKLVNFADEYGNSIALYTLLILVALGVWLVSPIPSPSWSVNGAMMGWASVILVSVTSLHGLLWFVITRQSLNLSSNAKQFLSSSIKVVKPLHMMTGMVGLGLAFIHGFAYMTFGAFGSVLIASGIVALVTLLILAIDGIGLMMTPFLSRQVHRWIAVTFLVSLVIHLIIIFV